MKCVARVCVVFLISPLLCLADLIRTSKGILFEVTAFASNGNGNGSCVAACCSVLQCVAVCCSVLQCVAVSCSVLQCVAVSCSE